MKTKHIIITYLIIVGILILAGFQLANATDREDRPVGMILITEYIGTFADPPESGEKTYPSTKAAPEASLSEQDRIYATKKEEIHDGSDGRKHKNIVYKFEQKEVIGYFYELTIPPEEKEDPLPSRVLFSENISDLHIDTNTKDLSASDRENNTKMDAKIYFPAKEKGGTLQYTIGYIYQGSDGSVYATSGNAFQIDVDHPTNGGFTHSQTAEAMTNFGGKNIKESLSLNLSSEVIHPPEKYRILQLDREMKVLSSDTYEPGGLPEEILPEKNAVCCILQSFSTDADGQEVIALEIADPGKESISYFSCTQSVCDKKSIYLKWNDRA